MIVEAKENDQPAVEPVTKPSEKSFYSFYDEVKNTILGTPVPQTAFLSRDGTQVLYAMKLDHKCPWA